jgi:inositol-polyphosphate multikinase
MAPPKTKPDLSTFVAYSHAAAGHDGVRSDPTGEILIKPSTDAEVAFYESAKAHPAFQAYMPTFMGSLTLNKNQELSTTPSIAAPVIPKTVGKDSDGGWIPSGGKELDTGLSIVLENITAGFTRPNVIDLKLGARLWADDAPEAKRRTLDEVSDTTTSGSLGFRIAGMRVHRPEATSKEEMRFVEHIEVEGDGYMASSKLYGRAFNADNIGEAFVEYFGGKEALRKPNGAGLVVKRLAREVEGLVSVLEKEESRMYSASILMIYEGDERAMEAALDEEKGRAETGARDLANDNEEDEGSGGDSDEQRLKVHDMRLIDFAHARWSIGQGPDENALQGVRSVLKILERLFAEV